MEFMDKLAYLDCFKGLMNLFVASKVRVDCLIS